ncbi:MAG: hypothetical protein JXA90_02015, partial [Planctomycetes bacterium]|nr:hypothetical protein [Planctomycetota bacterium]
LVSFEQLESAWPVSGSVLVQDGTLYCVAGRSSFLDGGLRLLRLEPRSGKLISETILDERDASGKDLQEYVSVLNMPVALPDILSSDGEHVYMRSQRFDLEGCREQIAPSADKPFDRAGEQIGEGRHLFCPTGFLDDSWWHRTYWMYGKTFTSGCNWWFRAGRFAPAGRILVFDDSSIYGFGRQPEYFVWTPVLEYHLFGASREPDAEAIRHALAANERMEKEQNRAIFNRSVTRSAPLADLSAVKLRWSMRSPPLWARAMVLARGTLFIAGPPDVVDENEIWERRGEEDVARKMAEQAAALEGRKGALLWAVSADGGAKLFERELDALPVWDGMAATAGRLYLAMTDGKVRCFRER